MCKKIPYANLKFAKLAAKVLSKKLNHHMLYYHCPQCGKYHLTSAFGQMISLEKAYRRIVTNQ